MQGKPVRDPRGSGASFWLLGKGYTLRKAKTGNNAKKKSPRYKERDEGEREGFLKALEDLPDEAEVYYADESGFEEDYSRTYGYSAKGERVYGEEYGTHYGRTSVIGAISQDNEFMAGFAFKGYMNSALFEGWLEQVFIPSMKGKRNVVLIVDNASHHPKDRTCEIADENGISVMFLPKYSPDFNPIEKYWANIKNWLRLHLRNFDSFWDGLIRAFQRR